MILYGASGHAKVIIDILIDNKINIRFIYVHFYCYRLPRRPADSAQ